MHFGAVLTGTLRRHAQSLAAIAQGLEGLPQPLVWPGLDEYDGKALIGAIHPEPLARPDTHTAPEFFRQHFRLLRQGLAQWMAGTTAPAGMPSYAEFVADAQQDAGRHGAAGAGLQPTIEYRDLIPSLDFVI